MLKSIFSIFVKGQPLRMNYKTWIFFIFVFFAAKPGMLSAQARIVKFNSIDSLLHQNTAPVLVLNFWATWCKPCVTELPHFEELNQKYSASGVKVILVSLDFKREFVSRVKPFIERNKITPEVLLLDEPDYNSWINKVDSTWSGAIPATVIISGDKKLFFEKEFTSFADLENNIKPLIQ